MSLAHISHLYASLLTPIPPFTWLGASISTLDILAAIRLCSVMRQIREVLLQSQPADQRQPEVPRSFTKSISATWTVVYGGEVITAAWLGQYPSFLISPTYPLLYLATQYFIDSLPWLPTMMFEIEAPLSFLDALTRSYLLTNLIPPAVLTHVNSTISNSPWTLLLVSFVGLLSNLVEALANLSSLQVTANGGFFIVNLFSMLQPGGWYLATPSELKAYGWTTVDLWAAPLITGFTALLTQAQPFWTYLHLSLVGFSRPLPTHNNPDELLLKPWNIEDARAFGAVVLWVLFASRTVNNFGAAWWNAKPKRKEVMRSRIDGRRYPGISKSKKTQ